MLGSPMALHMLFSWLRLLATSKSSCCHQSRCKAYPGPFPPPPPPGRISLEELGLQGRSDDCSCTTSATCSRCSSEYDYSPALPTSSSASDGSDSGRAACYCSMSNCAMDLNGMVEALPLAGDGAAAEDGGPRPPITYMHIYEDGTLSLGIFCLPARARIPLHNHPGMTVLTRVLYGQLHVQSCDWLEPGGPDRLPREAVNVVDSVFCSADEPVALFPSSGGNIHQFTALTDCAVLDLMSPPYSTEVGGSCTRVVGQADCRLLWSSGTCSAWRFTAARLMRAATHLLEMPGMEPSDALGCQEASITPTFSPTTNTAPRDSQAGRDCSYYRPVPGSAHSLQGEVMLLDGFDPPSDFVIGAGLLPEGRAVGWAQAIHLKTGMRPLTPAA